MKRENHISHFFYLLDTFICFYKVDMYPGRYGRTCFRKIFFITAETGYDHPAGCRIDRDRLPSRRMTRTENNFNSINNICIPINFYNIYPFQNIPIIPVVNRVRIIKKLNFLFLHIYLCIYTFIIIFTMIIMQVGMNNDIYILGSKVQC